MRKGLLDTLFVLPKMRHKTPRDDFQIYSAYMTSNCHTFFKKKLQKSVTIWEHLPKG